MALVPIQNKFLTDLADLILEAQSLGLIITGGELWRTKEQQQVYFVSGKSKTMNSMHLKRLAIDLNFFKPAGGKIEVTSDKAALQEIGDFWEGLDPDNRWGGNWTNFLDVGHFERKE